MRWFTNSGFDAGGVAERPAFCDASSVEEMFEEGHCPGVETTPG